MTFNRGDLGRPGKGAALALSSGRRWRCRLIGEDKGEIISADDDGEGGVKVGVGNGGYVWNVAIVSN